MGRPRFSALIEPLAFLFQGWSRCMNTGETGTLIKLTNSWWADIPQPSLNFSAQPRPVTWY